MNFLCYNMGIIYSSVVNDMVNHYYELVPNFGIIMAHILINSSSEEHSEFG